MTRRKKKLLPVGNTLDDSFMHDPVDLLEREILRWRILEWMGIDPRTEMRSVIGGWDLSKLPLALKVEALHRVEEWLRNTPFPARHL
jgi:hypothetical protein